jgi:hypothetical protein
MRPFRLALALALGLTLLGGGPAFAAGWIATAMPWTVLPSMKPAGALPQTFAIPSKAWTYGAASARTDVFAKSGAVILRVEMTVASGRVGVSLMTPDGATLLSKERVLQAQSAPAHVYFRILPSAKPGMIVLRNYDDDGRQSSVTVTRTEFIRDSDLSNEDLTEVVTAGIL